MTWAHEAKDLPADAVHGYADTRAPGILIAGMQISVRKEACEHPGACGRGDLPVGIGAKCGDQEPRAVCTTGWLTGAALFLTVAADRECKEVGNFL